MNVSRTILVTVALAALCCACRDRGTEPARAADPAATQPATVLVVPVISQPLQGEARLPGELHAYQDVAVYSEVQGFVEEIGVDRGSVVKQGDVLARLIAPELTAQRSEADAKARAARAQGLEAQARLA